MTIKGRKRKTNVIREPNGRPSRVGRRMTAEQEALQTAIEYRQRVFGISARDALDQKSASLLGRLCMQGVVSEDQWQAGEDWAKLVSAYHAAINAPRGFQTVAGQLSTRTEEEQAAWCRSRKKSFDAANAAIKDHAPAAEERQRFMIMTSVVLDQIDIPNQHGTLRTALNGLVKHFRLEGRQAA